MADPKYANLPGIAYDQPDVYETTDLPEADQPEDTFEDENECIERLHLSAPDAFLKFKDKQLYSDRVDFSDRLKKVPNRGYDSRSGVWELAGQGEKETPLQKYQRLQCEMKELMEEVSELKEIAKDDAKEETAAYKAMASQIEKAQKQLADFRLEETLGPELLASLKDPQTAHIKKLMARLETFEQKSLKAGTGGAKSAPSENAAKDVVTYELRYRPDQTRLQQTSRVAELEQRLHKLEAILGASSDSMARLGSNLQNQSLCAIVQNLEGRVALLNPSQLEGIESRLTAVAQKMDTIGEKTTAQGQIDPEKDKKISELYEIVKKTEPISSFLPQTIDRLKTLESLHRQASEFATSLSKLETLNAKVVGSLESNEKLLHTVEKSFAENVDTIKKNMAGLDQRLAALPKK